MTTDNPAINILAAVYFIANTFLAFIAVVALWFAKRQFLFLRDQNDLIYRSGKATTYLEINDKYNKEDVQYSRLKIIRIKRYYDSNKEIRCEFNTVGDYANHFLSEIRSRGEENWECNDAFKVISGVNSEYSRTLFLLTFFEDLGLLSERGYVRKEDIFDFMGGLIIACEEILCKHIQETRKSNNSKTLFANAIKLMQDAKKHKTSAHMIEFNDGYYKL